MEAYDADLKSKEHIQELVLEWGKQAEDSQIEKEVLDALQPSINLRKLDIDLYGGTSFPNWLGDSSFSNMVSVRITNCSYCMTLPPLGKLPSLKDLVISDMQMLESIGLQFYGMTGGSSKSSFQPFPSLQTLHFQNMPNFKEWFPIEGNTIPFASLKSLTLDNCPELRGHFLSLLSYIEEIEILGCDHLLATPLTLHSLSSIKKIHIDGDLDSEWESDKTRRSLLGSDSPCLLLYVSIWNCSTLRSLPKMFLSSTCLQRLSLNNIPYLTAFPTDGLPISLKSLRIDGCNNLSFLPPETHNNYTSLVELVLVNSCDALTSFPLDSFPELQSLSVIFCASLESIFISGISSHYPSTLQSLSVLCCMELRSLPQRMDTLTALEHLMLEDIPELKLSFLPPKLQSIHICSKKLQAPVTGGCLQHLTTLSKLTIGGDDDIVNTLLKEQLLPISLVSLTISNISERKSLEGNGIQCLYSLRKLEFRGCSELESLPKFTPPSALKSLIFWRCEKLKSFPEDMLPCSLESLEFGRCARLELLQEDSLPSSLKLLTIRECPVLEERYESKKHWSNIAHIPVIRVNGKVTIS